MVGNLARPHDDETARAVHRNRGIELILRRGSVDLKLGADQLRGRWRRPADEEKQRKSPAPRKPSGPRVSSESSCAHALTVAQLRFLLRMGSSAPSKKRRTQSSGPRRRLSGLPRSAAETASVSDWAHGPEATGDCLQASPLPTRASQKQVSPDSKPSTKGGSAIRCANTPASEPS